jgi:hypothetical protein
MSSGHLQLFSHDFLLLLFVTVGWQNGFYTNNGEYSTPAAQGAKPAAFLGAPSSMENNLAWKFENDSFHVGSGAAVLSPVVATPLWAKCEGEAHTPKNGKLESSGTLENLELDCRGQISSHLSALGVIGKVLKCRCPKWPRMSHLDICSPSYGRKKGRESN